MDQNVTPEYLLEHGFFRYNSKEETEIYDTPFVDNDSLHFMEKNKGRNMFVVIFSPRISHEGFVHQICVQNDAGCGFVSIPERWWDLPIKYFESIYFGINGEYPQKNK